jgi:hypothetical protein
MHHILVDQTAQEAAFDQLTKPLPTGAAVAQQPAPEPQWIPVR